MTPPIRAVVFDLDGLMLNTEDIFELAGQQLMQRRGREMTDECRYAMLGLRPEEAFAELQRITGIEEPIEQLMRETREIFESLIDDHLAPMPGLFELLDDIDGRGLPRGVATSSPRDYLAHMLGRYQLLEGFPVRLAAEDVQRGKPHPEIYLRAASELGIAPQEMLVLEDSETGTRAGADAGAVVISVPNRHTRRQDFSRATHVVGSLDVPVIRSVLDGITV